MANNYSSLEGTMDAHGMMTGEIQFNSGSGNGVKDVKVNGTSVVDANKIANVDLTPYAEIENVYDKQTIDTALEGKADTDDIPTELSDLTDDENHRLVTDTEKSTWDNKADVSDIPTVNNPTITIQKNDQNVDTFSLNQTTDKVINIPVPTKTSDLQNDNSFITNTVNNLANYYLKSDTYTQTEVNNLISAAVNGRFEKVTTLPASGEPNVIYLVPKTTALTNNVYDEYIWQDNAWELLGSTEIDLSNYVTTTDLATALADYVTTSAFNTAIANYYTKTEVGNLLDAKVDKISGKGLSTNDYDNTAKGIVDGVTNALAGKVDKVNGKGLSTEDYTTTEKNKLSGISTGANKVESSTTNGNIQIDGTETQVYDDSDIQDKIDVSLESVSGNPLSISGLKSSQLAVNPVITYNPIQDLHGQSKPYPAGGGKNKLPMTVQSIKDANTSGTWSGNAYTQNNITFTILTDSANNVVGINVTANNSSDVTNLYIAKNISISSGSYILNGCPSGGSSSNYEIDADGVGTDTGSGKDITISSTFNLRIRIASGVTMSNKAFYPMIRLATESDSSFAPYENICPISGYDKIEVLSCGKNLLDFNAPTRTDTNATIKINGNTVTFTSTATYYPRMVYDLTPFKTVNNGHLRISGVGNASGSNTSIRIYDGSTVKYNFNITTNTTFDTDINIGNIDNPELFFYISTTSSASVGQTLSVSNFILCADSLTDKTYVPYHKTTDLSESLGQTVYGGTYEPRTGLFTVTHKVIDMGEKTYTYNSSSGNVNLYSTSISDIKTTAGEHPFICECYDSVVARGTDATISRWNAYATDTNIYVNDSRYSADATGANDLKTALSGIKLVYELATPFTIQLTPHEIALSQGYAYISTNGTLIALDYHNGEMARLSDVELLNETIENQFALFDSKQFKYVDGVIKRNTTVTLDVPKAYLFITYATVGASLAVVIGNGYGKESSRHKITQLLQAGTGLTFGQSTERYGLVVTNTFSEVDVSYRLYTLVE